MKNIRTVLAALAWLPASVSSQPETGFEPAAHWTYMNRPGETISLTIIEQAPPGVVLNGGRETRYRVYASGFHSFSSPPTQEPDTHAVCMYVTREVFDSPLSKHDGTTGLTETDPCEALAGQRTYSSFDQVIDSIERPIAPALRARPELSADQREISGSVKPMNHCVPVYPEAAGAAKMEGWVIVEFTVSADGIPTEGRVVDASPPDIFDAAALEFLSRCRLERIDGEAVETQGVRWSVTFELEL